MTMTNTHHVNLDARGIAWIDDTNVKVIEVAADYLAHGTTPEQMHLEYPHLSIAQIHSALAYYYDHQQALDLQLDAQMRAYEQARATAGDTLGKAKLRRRGLL